MTPSDLELMLVQSCLVAKAEALGRGARAATLEEEAQKLRASLVQAGLWQGGDDAGVLDHYSLGKVSIGDLAQYFSVRA